MYQYLEKSARYNERTHDKLIPFTILSQTGKGEKTFKDFVFLGGGGGLWPSEYWQSHLIIICWGMDDPFKKEI